MSLINFKSLHHVWPRKGRQGFGKGRSEPPPESAPRQYSRHHKAGDPAAGEERKREEDHQPHLRGDEGSHQDLSGE